MQYALLLFVLLRDLKRNGITSMARLIVKCLKFIIVGKLRSVNKSLPNFMYQSLRKTMDIATKNYSKENEVMRMLRKGRW